MSATTIELAAEGLSNAAICRKKRWGVGTRLIGTDAYGTREIQISAVGHWTLLARDVRLDGTLGSECSWTLDMRDWKRVRR